MANSEMVSWSAEDLNGPSLLNALGSVVPDALEGAKPIVATVLTLGLYVKGITSTKWVSLAQELAKQHPSRILVINPAGADGKPRLDVAISATVAERGQGETPTLFSECVELNLKGALATHWIDFLQPLIRPGLPAYLWWLVTPPSPDFRWDLLSTSGFTHLVMDSKTGNWRQWLPSLRQALAYHMHVDDLEWQRLRDLRHHWAQLTDAPQVLKTLLNMESVEVTTPDLRWSQWVWWVAWISSRLGWNLVLDADRTPVAMETDFGPVPIVVRETADTTLTIASDDMRITTHISQSILKSVAYRGNTAILTLDEHRIATSAQEDMHNILNRGHDVLFSQALEYLLAAEDSLGGTLDA
jgi:glucose-6-phosphate dehydrogenase assembly protein OpcA